MEAKEGRCAQGRGRDNAWPCEKSGFQLYLETSKQLRWLQHEFRAWGLGVRVDMRGSQSTSKTLNATLRSLILWPSRLRGFRQPRASTA